MSTPTTKYVMYPQISYTLACGVALWYGWSKLGWWLKSEREGWKPVSPIARGVLDYRPARSCGYA